MTVEEKTQPRSVRFGLNVLWNLLGQIALILLSFFLVPYLVRHLGEEGYALYGLLGVISGYLLLLTLGSGNANVKFISECLARRDLGRLMDILRLSLLMHAAGVVLGAVLLYLLRRQVALDFFKISPAMSMDAIWIVECAAVASVFISLIQWAGSLFLGAQKFGAANSITLLQTGSVLGGSALLLHMGFAVKEVGWLFMGIHLFLAAASLWAAAAQMPISPAGNLLKGIDNETAKSYLSYSLNAFLAQLAWSVCFQWDKIFIAYFFPLSQLTYYLIPSFIMQKFWIIPSSVSLAAFPLMSELAGLEDSSSLKKVYRLCGQLILWLVIPALVILFILAPQLLTLWLGSVFSEKGVWPLRFLLLGYLFHFLAAMPNTAAYGTGRPQYGLAWQSLQAFLCVFFWYLLLPKRGIAGTALGFLLAQGLTSLPYAWLVSRSLFQMSLWEYWEGIMLQPLVSGGFLIIFLWPLRAYAWDWTSLIGLSAFSMILYYGLGFWFLGREERETLSRLWSGLKKSALTRPQPESP